MNTELTCDHHLANAIAEHAALHLTFSVKGNIPAMDWLPEEIALSMMNTRRMKRNGAAIRRINVDRRFLNATLTAPQLDQSAQSYAVDGQERPDNMPMVLALFVIQQRP